MTDIISWSPVDASNNAAPPAGWPENMQPSAVNDCARAMMGAIRRNYDATLAGTLVLPYLSTAGGTISGNVTIAGTTQLSYLHVTGVSDFDQDLRAHGNFFVTGTSTLGSTGISFLDVSGDAYVDGVLYPRNGLVVTGNSSFAGNMTVSGSVSVGYLRDYGSADFDGDVRGHAGGYFASLSVSGPATVNSNMTIQNSLTLGGNIDVGGSGTFRNDISVVGISSAASFQGGPAGAAYLQTYGATNHVSFRWDGAAFFYRIDDVLEQKVCRADPSISAVGIFAGVGGSPTGYALVGYVASGTPFVAWCNEVSDARLKENIEDSSVDALAAVLATRVRAFDWNPAGREYMPDITPHTSIGLVAQELRDVMPDAVGVTDFPENEATARLPRDMHSVNYERVTAYLLRAVQQLSARIDSLTTTGESRV